MPSHTKKEQAKRSLKGQPKVVGPDGPTKYLGHFVQEKVLKAGHNQLRPFDVVAKRFPGVPFFGLSRRKRRVLPEEAAPAGPRVAALAKVLENVPSFKARPVPIPDVTPPTPRKVNELLAEKFPNVPFFRRRKRR